MISLIGITGQARHGKDTVGKMLLSHMPAATRFAYADKIKEFLLEAVASGESMEQNKEGSVLFLTSRAELETAMLNTLHLGLMQYAVPVKEAVDALVDVLKAHHGNLQELHDGRIVFTSSWRKLFQITGTEWARETFGERFWIDPWLPKENAVITDVRGHGATEHRDIEAQSIIDNGGVVIRVFDPRIGEAVRSHSSESGISDAVVAHTIINDGSLEELEDKVKAFLYIYLLSGEE